MSTAHPRATLAATILGSSLAFIDGSVVNVALPALGADLHASPSSLPWTITAYLLPLGALILRGGRLPLSVGAGLAAAGLALYARVGTDAVNYWLDVLPPTLLVALGMGASVAPLTTGVIASVDTDHVGIASGFNSAVARIAGLVATALLAFVFARQDSTATFVAGFRAAALIGAASAAVAAASALWLLPAGGLAPQERS